MASLPRRRLVRFLPRLSVATRSNRRRRKDEKRDGDVPTFVYGIFVSLFIFFNSFAVNMALQYRQVGRWRSYVFGEGAYLALSLGAKSALAWQVFGGTLAS